MLKRLTDGEIQFVLIGGLAAVVHGSAYVTNDLDLCYERSVPNLKKLAALLKTLKATLRNAPTDLPFQFDERAFALGMNFTFDTTLGAMDLIGEVAGLGTYPQVIKHAEPFDLYGLHINTLSVAGLIKAKEASHRPKDIAHLTELRALQSMKR